MDFCHKGGYMKNYLLIALGLTVACATAADRQRRDLLAPEAEVPSHMKIKYYKTHEDAVNNVNPRYIKMPVTKSMYLSDLQDALRQKLGQGNLMMDDIPMHERQLKFYTIGQFFEPRQRMAQMTFEDMEQQFSFWPAKRTLR